MFADAATKSTAIELVLCCIKHYLSSCYMSLLGWQVFAGAVGFSDVFLISVGFEGAKGELLETGQVV